MGVELGKVLAKNILAQLGSPADVKGHDSSVRSAVVPPVVPCAVADTCRTRLLASSTTIRRHVSSRAVMQNAKHCERNKAKGNQIFLVVQ